MYDQLKIDPAEARNMVAEARENLRASKGLSDLRGFALAIIAKRLKASPRRYTDMGPYWWAVKDLLAAAGHVYGPTTNRALAAEYRGEDAETTLVLADQFRTDWLSQHAVGSRDFLLHSDDVHSYVLFDPDMES